MARPSLLSVIEITKPLTWFAPMWAFACGVISSGLALAKEWPLILGGLVLAGPLVCGTSQAVNDWFDRHVDAVNEPKRPIPSGRLPGFWGFYLACAFTGLSLGLASALGRWGFIAAIFALLAAWAYSAPPLRLKRNGWLGNAAVGLCYEGLPWFTGASIMAAALPNFRILLVALLYSIGAHGIMTLNDFKSEEGDRKFGIRSLPVQLGVKRAAWVACFTMAVPQAVVIGALIAWGGKWSALAIGALLAAQLILMRRFVGAPRAQAIWYNATGTSLYVLGMLVTAFALRPEFGTSA
jgi:chlorophyll/bacteriochlorophyll a synthase